MFLKIIIKFEKSFVDNLVIIKIQTDGTGGDPPATPQPPSTTTTTAPGVDDVIVVCNEDQCGSWYGDNYTGVPYFNAQERQSCLRGCYPPPGKFNNVNDTALHDLMDCLATNLLFASASKPDKLGLLIYLPINILIQIF